MDCREFINLAATIRYGAVSLRLKVISKFASLVFTCRGIEHHKWPRGCLAPPWNPKQKVLLLRATGYMLRDQHLQR